MKNKLIKSNIFIVFLFLTELLLAFITTYACSGLTMALVCFALLIVLLALPCLLMKRKQIGAYFRFATLFFAFIPSFQPAILNKLLHNGNLLAFEFTKERLLILLSVFSKELLWVMLILVAICITDGFKIKKWQICLITLSAICCIGMLCFPALSEVLLYWMTYLLIIPCFYFWEYIFESCSKKQEKIPMWIFLFILFFRGLYQMLAILEINPLI